MGNNLLLAAKESPRALREALGEVFQQDQLEGCFRWALEQGRIAILRVFEHEPKTRDLLSNYLLTLTKDQTIQSLGFNQDINAYLTQFINMPDLTQRLPPKIKQEELVLQSSGREGAFIDYKAYQQFKKKQYEKQLNAGIYNAAPDGRPLKHPIFIGDNGEMIAMIRQINKHTNQLDSIKLGEGGFAAVYIGMDIDTGKFVAMKPLEVSPSKRVDQEAIDAEKTNVTELGRAVSTLDNNGITWIIDELAFGVDFIDRKKHLEQESDPAKQQAIELEKFDMAIDLLKQIRWLHQEIRDENGQVVKPSYIHRDIKGNNAIWDPINRRARLIDFGSARKTDDADEEGYMTTPFYTAPETLDEEGYSKESDVYALGVTLLQLFIKKDITQGVDPKAWVANLMMKPSLIAKHFNSFMDEKSPLHQLIKKMIDPNPDNRISLDDALKKLQALRMPQPVEPVANMGDFFAKLVAPEIELTQGDLALVEAKAMLYQDIEQSAPSFVNRLTEGSRKLLIQTMVTDGRFDLLGKAVASLNQDNAVYHVISEAVKNKEASFLTGMAKHVNWTQYLEFALVKSNDPALQAAIAVSAFFIEPMTQFVQSMSNEPAHAKKQQEHRPAAISCAFDAKKQAVSEQKNVIQAATVAEIVPEVTTGLKNK